MKSRYTLKMYYDDMGSFTQPGCRDLEDALWHVNKAREHDGLRPIELSTLVRLVHKTDRALAGTYHRAPNLKGWAKFTPED